MQFQIPQFLEIEDKIVGQLSLRQFLYVAGASAIGFILFFLLQLWLWIPIALILAALGLAGAFGKYNGQNLPKIVWLAFNYFWRPRLYLWQRQAEYREVEIEETAPAFVLPKMPNMKKLWQDLMTTKTPIPKREKPMRLPALSRTRDKYLTFRKITGDRDVARRIDYR